ncbi:hypothetical protein ABLB90_21825 [Photorhabdus bodei]|nr:MULTISPECIES: hypothetical protein [Photorhabdus]
MGYIYIIFSLFSLYPLYFAFKKLLIPYDVYTLWISRCIATARE